MTQALPNPNGDSLQLTEEEASELAAALKAQTRSGTIAAHDEASIERMVAGLGDRRGLLRLTFAESLGAIGSAAVPALCQAMRQHSNVTVRRAAAKTLTLIEDPSALDDLEEAFLSDADPVVQGSAMGAIAAVGETAVDRILGVLINPRSTPMHLGLASWALAFVGSKAPGALRAAAQSEHVEIRTAAIAALGDQIQSLGDEEARQLVLAALRDPDADVRAEASTLLGKLHDAAWAAPPLVGQLQDQDAQVRKNAALSLMKLRATDALNSLQQQLQRESDAGVQAILQLAINQLSDG